MQHELTANRTPRVIAIALSLVVAFCLGWAAFGAGLAYADPEEGQQQPEAAAQEGQEQAPTESQGTAADAASSSTSSTTTTAPGTTQGTLDSTADSDGLIIGNDVFYYSRSIDKSKVAAPANLFASGSSVTMKDGVVGSDVFLAGDSVNLESFTSGNNLFVGGNNLTLSDVTALTIFAAGNNLDINAEANNLTAAGRTIFLKGVFYGDVNVTASSVIVDPYLQVNGTLNVTAEQEPTIASTTKLGSFNYNQLNSGQATPVSNPLQIPAIGSAGWLWYLLFMFLGMLVLGIVMLLLLRTEVVDSAGELLKERPLAIFVTGIVATLLVPVVIVLFFVTLIGWTVAVGLLFVFAMVSIMAGTYTAISIGRAVMSGVNKWVTSILFIAIFALLFSLPIANIIIGFVCSIYCTGCVIQGWWVWRRRPAEGHDDDLPPYEEFAVPRGTHVNPRLRSRPCRQYVPCPASLPPIPQITRCLYGRTSSGFPPVARNGPEPTWFRAVLSR